MKHLLVVPTAVIAFVRGIVSHRLKRSVAYILVAGAAFVLGVAVSPIHFRFYSVACGPRGSSSQFTSSYLLNLVSAESYYESLEEADAAWQEELEKCDAVLEQTALLNRDGEKVGSRAVIRLKREDGKQYFGVVWTQEKVLYGVYCSSLAHVLAFEKRH